MIFTPTTLQDAYVIELEKTVDERGFFARSWCRREFEDHRLDADLAQCNISFSQKKGTLRGMHYQLPPFAETKLVRCTRGSIYDVIIDLRPDSPTFLQWFGIDLTAENRRMLYVPKGFAHGFQTLADSTEVFYQMSEFYAPKYAQGFRWDDELVNIAWPLKVTVISDKDSTYPNINRSQLFAQFENL